MCTKSQLEIGRTSELPQPHYLYPKDLESQLTTLTTHLKAIKGKLHQENLRYQEQYQALEQEKIVQTSGMEDTQAIEELKKPLHIIEMLVDWLLVDSIDRSDTKSQELVTLLADQVDQIHHIICPQEH